MEKMLHSCHPMLRIASFPYRPHSGSSDLHDASYGEPAQSVKATTCRGVSVTCAVGDEHGFPRRFWLGSPLARQDDDKVVQQGYGGTCGCTKRKADSVAKKAEFASLCYSYRAFDLVPSLPQRHRTYAPSLWPFDPVRSCDQTQSRK
jgi:hypothetical protein